MALYFRGLEKFNLFRSSVGLNPTLVKIEFWSNFVFCINYALMEIL
jgi:hypothetical protein